MFTVTVGVAPIVEVMTTAPPEKYSTWLLRTALVEVKLPVCAVHRTPGFHVI